MNQKQNLEERRVKLAIRILNLERHNKWEQAEELKKDFDSLFYNY